MQLYLRKLVRRADRLLARTIRQVLSTQLSRSKSRVLYVRDQLLCRTHNEERHGAIADRQGELYLPDPKGPYRLPCRGTLLVRSNWMSEWEGL